MAKDLNCENYKMLMKEIEDDTNRCKNIPCSSIGRVSIVKNDYTTQGILQIQWNPCQITNGIFTELEQTILFMEAQKTKQSWKRKTAGRIRLTLDHTTMLPSSKQCGTAQKQKYRSMEHHAKSRNKPTHLWSINLGGKKTIHCRKDILSNKWCQKNWTETHKKWN